MTLHQTLAKNTIQQLVGKAISTALGMVAVAIMTRYLGVEKFGWYVTAVGFLQFVGLISDFGFTVTTSNLLAEPTFAKRAVLETAFSWRFISALVFQLLAPLVFLLFPYPAEIKYAVAITTVSFFFLAISQIFIGFYREGLNIRIPVMAEIISRVILVGGVAMVANNRGSFLLVMTAITIASIASTAYLWLHCRPLKFNFDKSITAALWHKLGPTALTIIFNAIYLQGDRVLLPLFVDQTQVSFYGASYRVLDIIIQTAALIMGLIMPLITFAWSRGLMAEFKKRLDLGFTTLALVMVPMSAGVILLANKIIVFVAGPKFARAGPMLALLTISMFGVVFGMAFGHVMLAIDKQRQTIWVYTSCALISLVSYLLFIPHYGTTGAIGVTIFSEWYTGLCLLILTKHNSGQLPNAIPFLKIVAATLLMVLIIWPYQTRSLALTIPLGIISYATALFALRVIKPTHLKLLLSHPNS